MSHTTLEPRVIALVCLAAGVAAGHPTLGLCQMKKLRKMGMGAEQIAAVIEIACHVRDDAIQQNPGAIGDDIMKSQVA